MHLCLSFKPSQLGNKQVITTVLLQDDYRSGSVMMYEVLYTMTERVLPGRLQRHRE